MKLLPLLFLQVRFKKKDCNNTMMKMSWTFKWESKETVAHRSLSFSVVHSSDNCHHIALYSYRVPLFSFSERHKLVFYSSVESVSREIRFQTRADSDFRHSLRHKYLKQCIYTMYESIFIHYTWEKNLTKHLKLVQQQDGLFSVKTFSTLYLASFVTCTPHPMHLGMKGEVLGGRQGWQ